MNEGTEPRRTERTVTDRFGSMTVRMITYDEIAPAAVLAEPVPGDRRQPRDLRQLVRFCCVGASGFVVNLAVFRAADTALPYLAAFALAFVVSALSNFVWNRVWTFPGAAGRTHAQLVRFVIVSATALGLDLAILAALVEGAAVPKLAAAALAIVVVTPLSFLCNKLWSFAGA